MAGNLRWTRVEGAHQAIVTGTLAVPQPSSTSADYWIKVPRPA
jgi:hypothetical protein